MKPIGKPELRAPAHVLDLDLDDPTADERVDVARFATLWCLARQAGYPLGVTFWDVGDDETVSSAELRERVVTALREAAPAETAPPHLLDVPQPSLAVAICTRDRPDALARALASLHQQSDPQFSVVVVDNAPRDDATRKAVTAAALADCDYVIEPAPGLSRARNAALGHVHAEVVAWMDDDETADRDWVRRLKYGFAHPCLPDAVCGLMLPAELETEAQVRFEQYGGFNKGRGFASEVLSVAAGSVRSPLYPLPNFGAGGNMAFRMSALRAAGNFDPCLGPGTRTRNGEETKALAAVLRQGGTILYWPAAVQWHYHRREMSALRSQLSGYGAGLSAFLASMFADAPLATTRELVGLVPKALRDARPGETNVRVGMLPPDFPAELANVGREGFLRGAFDYARERLDSRLTAGRR